MENNQQKKIIVILYFTLGITIATLIVIFFYIHNLMNCENGFYSPITTLKNDEKIFEISPTINLMFNDLIIFAIVLIILSFVTIAFLGNVFLKELTKVNKQNNKKKIEMAENNNKYILEIQKEDNKHAKK